MAKLDTKFQSAKQDWETPASLFDPINTEFNFTLHAAASAANTKVKVFYDQASDGMAQPWAPHTVWLNPPYGDPKRPLRAWVEKGYRESRKGATVVMLIPSPHEYLVVP